jgi:DNA-binding MarR family transcriptional regulator
MSHEDVDCAQELLEAVPAVMRFIRAEMREHRSPGLSVPQFRTLVFIERAEGTSLGGIAEHLGLTPPSACKLVDGLQNKGLITRTQSQEDRRRVTIEITAQGKRSLTDARRETRNSLSEALAALDAGELAGIAASLRLLRGVFAADAGVGRRTRSHVSA